ncbi:Transcriptional regulator [Caballeronia sordidicola]|uniref:Transcriptional regulator n=2 Tax=Caballeronia sordidicola TaxID=196367 RepID=A0A242M5A1_CABSO|nr:Transcriptional regulator [Caballeronia sordidicola]
MESLRIFVAVIEEGSIAAAAARMHIVASAVSKRVSDLEDDTGTPLLYRHSRGVQATPAGEALYHHAKRLGEHLQQISDELSEYSEFCVVELDEPWSLRPLSIIARNFDTLPLPARMLVDHLDKHRSEVS